MLSVLFHMGQNHLNMVDCIIKDVSEQVSLVLLCCINFQLQCYKRF